MTRRLLCESSSEHSVQGVATSFYLAACCCKAGVLAAVAGAESAVLGCQDKVGAESAISTAGHGDEEVAGRRVSLVGQGFVGGNRLTLGPCGALKRRHGAPSTDFVVWDVLAAPEVEGSGGVVPSTIGLHGIVLVAADVGETVGRIARGQRRRGGAAFQLRRGAGFNGGGMLGGGGGVVAARVWHKTVR